MTALRVLSLSARTAAILLAPDGALYRLPAAVNWRLCGPDGARREGRSAVAPLFFEGLQPDSRYRLETDLGVLDFRTGICGGLVDVTEFGASPEAQDNAPSFAAALAALPEHGTLMIPPGRFVSGPVFLRPRMTLYIPAGAAFVARHDRTGWPILPARDRAGRPLASWEGLPEACFAAPLTGIDCAGLHITGRGLIDGGGDRGDWWRWPKETRNGARRPRTLFLAHSRDVSLSGFTIGNSPSWTVHPLRCDRLTAAALTIRNPPDSPNTDGFNPESCEDVTLTGLMISVGDDCIAVKAGKRAPGRTDHLHPTRRLTITHCHMERGHGAVVLGSEMSGSITDVTIARCSFDSTDRGLRIKTRRGRGGAVTGIRLDHVAMRNVPTPVAVNAFYFCDPDGHSEPVQSRAPAPVDETTPVIRDITLTDITADGVHLAVIALLGLPEAPITGIRFTGLRARFAPDAKAAIPLMADHVPAIRHQGLWADHAEATGRIDILQTDKDPLSC